MIDLFVKIFAYIGLKKLLEKSDAKNKSELNEKDEKTINEYANKLMKSDESQRDKLMDEFFKELDPVIHYVDKNKYLKLNGKHYRFKTKQKKNLLGNIFRIQAYVLDKSANEWTETKIPSRKEIKENGIWINKR